MEEKCLKPVQKTEKESVNLATQINHNYVAIRSLTLVHSKVTKHSNYTLYFASSTVKANSPFTQWKAHYVNLNMLEKLKQFLT